MSAARVLPVISGSVSRDCPKRSAVDCPPASTLVQGGQSTALRLGQSLGRSAENGFESPTRSAEHGFESPTRSAEHGFTLIELMVALVIFSLAAITLLRLQGVSSRTASEIGTKTVAQIVAQNLAVDALTDPTAPAFGTTSGVVENGGAQWRWVRTSKRTDDVRLARIDIAVMTADGRPGAALSLARAIK